MQGAPEQPAGKRPDQRVGDLVGCQTAKVDMVSGERYDQRCQRADLAPADLAPQEPGGQDRQGTDES